VDYRDEYANYVYIKPVTTINVHGTDKVLWHKDKEYKVIEILKSDRLANVESETDEETLIELDDQDFDFIEADED
jgi:hypothetical protein